MYVVVLIKQKNVHCLEYKKKFQCLVRKPKTVNYVIWTALAHTVTGQMESKVDPGFTSRRVNVCFSLFGQDQNNLV